jgi:H+/gluconate symporter-like permease
MARELFRVADIPHRLMPPAIALGTSTFTMSAMPGTPAIQNTIPMPFLGTTPFAAPGLGIIASAIMLAFGLWWLARAEAWARKAGEGYGRDAEPGTGAAADDQFIRERATSSHEFDPAEITHGKPSDVPPPIGTAIIPLLAVVGVNFVMSFLILPRLDFSFLGQERWGGTSLAGVAGVWSVAIALAVATATLIALNRARLADLRASMDAGANASVLPIFSVASLVGFGAVVAALPAFALVRDWVLSISGGPLVSLAIATNLLAALTGSASGGLTIALDALGGTYLQIARTAQIDPGLMHRIAVIGSGTLDSLPHNGAVVTLLAVCGSTHRDSYFDMVMANIVGPVIALVAVIALGSMLGSF